jgi:hypothetical protein
MSRKVKLYTRRLLHRYKLREAAEAKLEQHEADTGFKRAHDAEMSKMLRGVDRDRWPD